MFTLFWSTCSIRGPVHPAHMFTQLPQRRNHALTTIKCPFCSTNVHANASHPQVHEASAGSAQNRHANVSPRSSCNSISGSFGIWPGHAPSQPLRHMRREGAVNVLRAWDRMRRVASRFFVAPLSCWLRQRDILGEWEATWMHFSSSTFRSRTSTV